MQNDEQNNIPIVKVDFDRKDSDKNSQQQDPANFYNFNYPSELKPAKVINKDEPYLYKDEPLPPPNHFNPALNNYYGNNHQQHLNTTENRVLIDNNNNNNRVNNQNNNNKGFFSNMVTNFEHLSGKKRTSMFVMLVISSIIYAVAFYFIFIRIIIPRLSDYTTFKFACAKANYFNEAETELCFIAAGHISFGIIAFGQLAIGIIAVGQVSGGLITIGQASVGLIYNLIGQVVVAAISKINQVGICLLYCEMSMICTAPLRPLIKKDKPPYVACCK